MQNTIDSNIDLTNNFDFKVKLSIIYIVLIYGIVIILRHKDSMWPKYAVKMSNLYIFPLNTTAMGLSFNEKIFRVCISQCFCTYRLAVASTTTLYWIRWFSSVVIPPWAVNYISIQTFTIYKARWAIYQDCCKAYYANLMLLRLYL